MSAHATPRLTPDRYLEIERAAEWKSEYHGGQMFAMSGGTLAHARIATNLAAALTQALREGDCTVVNSDLRVAVSPHGPFVYPDLTAWCGEPLLADGQNDMLMNPVAIFEVLSPSTEAYDRGYKFAQYRRIESLREYVLISPDEARIEVFARSPEGKWILTESVGIAAVCRLTSLGRDIELADIYRGISLETA